MTFAAAIGLDALNFMLALLLVTLGLVVIFGLMGVINMAHGEFFLIGAYCLVLVERAGYAFWWALLLSPLVLAIIGLAVEELVVRHVYRRFIDSILATWGISLALKQTVIILFGPTAQSVVSPIPGPVEIVGVVYPAYRFFIMGVAVVLTGATFLLFYRTRSAWPYAALLQTEQWRHHSASTPACSTERLSQSVQRWRA
jgi:urea transport system permease protein